MLGNNNGLKMILARRDYVWLALIVAYFAAVAHFAQNIPIKDDYDAILLALANYLQYGSARIFFFWPQNEHIIVPVRFFAWLMYTLSGKINFLWLILLGNLFLLGLFVACLRLVGKLTALTLPLLLSMTLLLFNFSFWESSLWAMAALSNIVVLAFSAAALACLSGQPSARNLLLAMLCAALASVSQANGVFASLACLFCLAAQGRGKALLLFIPVTLLCLGFFYLAHSAQTLDTAVVGQPAYAFTHPLGALCYMLMFFGSVIPEPTAALLLGSAMIITWGLALLLRPGLWRSGANAMLLFLLLTGLGVTLGRASLGMQGAYAPRYSMNSVLFLALLVGMCWPWLRERAALGWALAVLALFGNAATLYGVYPAINAQISQGQALYDKTEDCEPLHANYPVPAHADMIMRKSQYYGLYAFPLPSKPAMCPIRALPLVAPHARVGSALLEGYLDSIRIADNTLVLGGWWRVPDQEWGSGMLIATPTPTRKITIARVLRPDLVRRFNSSDYLHSGFGVVLEFADPAEAQAAAKSVCIAYEAGMDFMTMYPLQKQPNACPQFIIEKKAA